MRMSCPRKSERQLPKQDDGLDGESTRLSLRAHALYNFCPGTRPAAHADGTGRSLAGVALW